MSMRKFRPRVVAACAVSVAWALALAGCGAGVGYNDAIGRRPPPGTGSPPVVTGTGAPDTGSGAITPRSGPVPTSGTGAAAASAFCRDVTDVQGLISLLMQSGGTAAAAGQARALVQRLKQDAPAELRPAVDVLAQIENRIYADLSATPINTTDLTAALTDPGYRQAIQQVVIYAAQHCSITQAPLAP